MGDFRKVLGILPGAPSKKFPAVQTTLSQRGLRVDLILHATGDLQVCRVGDFPTDPM